MKLLWTLAASLLLLSVLAGAQGTIAPAQPPSGFISGPGSSVLLTTTINIGPEAVKGSPLSADVITEFDRSLADGNRIHQETHGKMFRDSEGRTRTENDDQILGLSSPHVFIYDPVERVSISIDVRNKSAYVYHMPSSSKPPAKIQPLVTPARPLGPVRHESNNENLGSMQIEGFSATGMRNTRTVPAGEMGNEKPLITTIETWTSVDLHTTLLTTTEDPMSGKTTRKLVNIQTGEPDPQLFQVPPDYTVKDNPQK